CLAGVVVQQAGLTQARPSGDVAQGGSVKPGRGEDREARAHDLLPTDRGPGGCAAWPASRHARNIAEKNLKIYLVLGRFLGYGIALRRLAGACRRSAQQVSRLNEAAVRQAVLWAACRTRK